MSQAKPSKTKRKNFSSFDLTEAYKHLNITQLIPWDLSIEPITLSDFCQQRLAKLQRFFDLRGYEESKKLVIDALCEEGLEGSERLKIWKGANLTADTVSGNADYLIAERRDYLEAPLLCIVEAQKDDFEQGLAQCLVEMKACQWNNHQINRAIDVFGIVTNADTWRFYQLRLTGEVYETAPHAIGEIEIILGYLHYIFQQCEQNLSP